MTKGITLGVRLTADGKGFVGGITVSGLNPCPNEAGIKTETREKKTGDSCEKRLRGLGWEEGQSNRCWARPSGGKRD